MPDQSSAASEHALLQEITAPLETLPDDPLALVEADFPTAMRGYDRHAVDDYVEQMTRLVAELHATRSPEAAVRRALERVGDQVSGVLQRAHETAEKITAQSRMEAEDRLERARREGLTLIESAERRVRELDADADRIWAERARIIADAEALSGQLLAVARDAAGRFPQEETRAASVVVDHIADRDPADDEAATAAEARAPRPWAEPEPAVNSEPPVEVEPEAFEPEPEAAFEPGAALPAEPEPEAELPVGFEPPVEAEPPVEPEPGSGAVGPPLAEKGHGEAGAGEVEDPTAPIDPTERITRSQDDSTRIIPPSSDAARRRES